MKRTLLVAFLSLLSFHGFGQDDITGSNTFIGIYGGVGVATLGNYDVGKSVGFEFIKGVSGDKSMAARRVGIGADLFYQTFSLLYDNEQFAMRHGAGNAGAILRHTSSYIFITPKFDYGVGYRQRTHIYLTAGAGFKMGGYDSLRKWDHSFATTSPNNYDSSLDMSKNQNSMILRVGFGLKQYLYIGDHWRFTITEDFGFVTTSLSKTGGPIDPSRTEYTPTQIKPGYISLQIGIMHTKYP